MNFKIVILFLVAIVFVGCEEVLIGNIPENTARNNFDILCKTFDENYAQFEVKCINWDSLYNVYSVKINDKTSDDELWNIMSDLILHLNDGHVNIYNRDFSKTLSGSNIIRTRKPDDFSIDLVKSKYLQNPRVAGTGFIAYGYFKNTNIGYIHIATFVAANSNNVSDWAYDIDIAMNELNNSEALMIDVRNNSGGLIVNENIIASAFINQTITYLYSRRKTGPKHNDLSNLISITVNPRNGVTPYTKPMVLLTNKFTASGGEYITQIFKNLTNCTQIGDTTFGAFGEITNVAQLPNGWTFRYPCTLTTTLNGKCLEGIGILPEILIENTKNDIDAGYDKVIEYATEYLLMKISK